MARQLTTAALLYAIVAATAVIYWPGIGGSFLLDDQPNLPSLEIVAAGVDRTTLTHYLMEDGAHPGRPITRLSFLFNADDWPGRPERFKYVNLMLHLANGLLLAWFCLLAATLSGNTRAEAAKIATATAALWLLNPLNVSTVLYVIQRATELTALFTLAGLVLYLHGRALAPARPRAGLAWMSAGAVVGTVLATLSKENGILFPLYVAAAEYTVFRAVPRPVKWGVWGALFLLPPIVFVVLWHVVHFHELVQGYSFREFTLGERLLTEPRVLLDYLVKTLIPNRAGTGVFHDDFAVSRGVWSPPSTALAIVVLGLLLGLALWLRRRAAVASFAILWFFAGHSLEAGPIPLELYFEHRNYLPMAGPLFALCYYALTMRSRARRVAAAAVAMLALVAGLVTWTNTRIWGVPLLAAVTWEEEHPTSVRALQYAADAWLRIHRFDEVRERLRRIQEIHPRHASSAIQLVFVDCLDNPASRTIPVDALIEHLASAQHDFAVLPSLDVLVGSVRSGRCTGISQRDLIRITDAVIENPRMRYDRKETSLLLTVKSNLLNRLGETEQAAQTLRASFDMHPSVRTAVLESIAWARIDRYREALAALDRADTLRSQSRTAWLTERGDLERWRQHLMERMAENNNGATTR